MEKDSDKTMHPRNQLKPEPAPTQQLNTWESEGGSVAFDVAKALEAPAFLPSLLTRDYALMDEAARRLLDGTSSLADEEKVAAFELFCKLKAALMDHVRFEEEGVFKTLDRSAPGIDEFIHAMEIEHRELVALATEATRELQDGHGIAFRVILREFLAAFRRHRKLETPFWYKQEARSCADDNIERMLLRSRDATL